MATEVAPGIWYHSRAEIGILKGVQLATGAPQEIGRMHYSTGQELGREDLAEWCRQIDAYHREHNGWLGFAYSFAVGRDDDPAKAHIFEGRGWHNIGAHTLNHNGDLGVVFLGNDDKGVNDATPGVRRAIKLLFCTPTGGKIGTERRTLREVHGHRETFGTDCPGDELEAWVKAGLPIGASPAPLPTPPKPVRPPTPQTPGWFRRVLSYPIPPKPGPTKQVRVNGQIEPMQYGEDVKIVQHKLGLPEDSLYGPACRARVAQYQGHHNLNKDGDVGIWTAAQLGR